MLLLGTIGVIGATLVTAIVVGQARRSNPLSLPDIRLTAVE
jgi:hypothetical protein